MEWGLYLRKTILERSSVSMFLIPVGMQVFQLDMMNVMGLMQWLIIGAFGVYFYTYSFDIYGVL